MLLPGFLAAVFAVQKVRDGAREAALGTLRETVRATALLVDGQVQRSLGGLTALGNSPHLQTGDFAAFYEEARALDLPPDVWTLLLDETGTQKLNTAVPFGTPPPPPVAKARVATVLATQRPLVTDVIAGPATGKLLTTIYLPAKPTPTGQRYVVAQAFSVEHWRKSALQPQGRADWIVAVIDRNGKFISRSHRTDEFLGRPARPELTAAAAAGNDGLIRHSTHEGIDAYDAFTHSALTGWTIAVAAPVDTIDASATQSIIWLALGIAIALAAALLGASTLSRILINAMEAASSAARVLGEGRQPAPPRTPLVEVNALNEALADAGRLLAHEKSLREVVEAERSYLLANERSAREAAQVDNAAKDNFLALLGHELRNPLAAISGATEVLARREPDPQTLRRYLEIIRRQNRHLSRIVNDLLEIRRMLSGKIVLEARPLDLAECVRSCVDSLQTVDRGQQSRLMVDAETVWIEGDPVRIEQVVNNLVTNAIKFSPLGTEVLVRVQARGEQALLEVTDAGSGIARELLPRVFEPFVQGPTVPGRPSSGLGIGLALVKQIVALHGGTVEARSAGLGHGSTFAIRLPRIAVPAKTDASAVPAGVRQSSLHVLVVEDNADAREATAELLRVLGYEVSEAEDGEVALRLAAARVPDVVVMDLGLPHKDGYAIAVEFKASPLLRHVPLIALSGYSQERDRQASAAAGFDAHLAKPVTPETLAQTIEAQLARRRAGLAAST